jgi:excisionase family DNA binding protein
MKQSIYKNYDELPLFLNAKTLAEVLGIAPSSAYELMHEKDFPVLKVGNRLLVEKSKFKEWIELNTDAEKTSPNLILSDIAIKVTIT